MGCEPALVSVGNGHWKVYAGRLICRGAAFAMLLSAGACSVELAGLGWVADIMRDYYHTWVVFFPTGYDGRLFRLGAMPFGIRPHRHVSRPSHSGNAPIGFLGTALELARPSALSAHDVQAARLKWRPRHRCSASRVLRVGGLSRVCFLRGAGRSV